MLYGQERGVTDREGGKEKGGKKKGKQEEGLERKGNFKTLFDASVLRAFPMFFSSENL